MARAAKVRLAFAVYARGPVPAPRTVRNSRKTRSVYPYMGTPMQARMALVSKVLPAILAAFARRIA